MLRSPRSATVALILTLAAGCSRSFHNPAEELGAGEVAGRATAPGAGGLGDVSVSLRGSALCQVTRPTGRFGLAPLPAGRHTVLLREGLARAEVREVELGYGSGGQVEGVWLGDLELPEAAALSGTFASIGASTEGMIVDEPTGMATYSNYQGFRMRGLPVGSHRVVAATHDLVGLWIAGPVSVTITADEAGTEKVLAPMSLRPAGGTGQLHFRVVSLVSGLDAGDAVVTVTDADRLPVTVPAPDSNGDRDLSLPEGPYAVEVRAPSGFPGVAPPPLRFAVVLGEEVADLGSFTLVDDSTVLAMQASCREDADCAPGTCVAGFCAGAAPPTLPPASAPVCKDLPGCATAGAACDLPGGFTAGMCRAHPAAPTSLTCIPCGTACTPDGAVTIAAACP